MFYPKKHFFDTKEDAETYFAELVITL
jgi:hypothetical protein